ncbi:MAG: hypothetical protein LBT59_00490 [Clostridiales bacterium]|nr:hypothetical protein [Clostridiales bacterium]
MKKTKEFLQKLDQDKLYSFILTSLRCNEQFLIDFNLEFDEPTDEDYVRLRESIDRSLYRATSAKAYMISVDTEEYMERAKHGYIQFAFDIAKHLFEQVVDMHDCFMPICEVDDFLGSCFADVQKIADLAVDLEDKAYVFSGCLELSDLDFSDCQDDYEEPLVDISATLLAKENHRTNKSDLSFFKDETHGDMFNQALLQTTIELYGEEAGARLPLQKNH